MDREIGALTEGIINASNKELKENPGDYRGEDGFLRCGVCGERKERNVEFNLNGKKLIKKVVCSCLCERAEQEALEQKHKEEEAELENYKRRRESFMDSRFFQARFENVKETKENQANIALCRKYAQQYDRMMTKNQGLLFWGDVGTGKSFAAACIANELLDQGKSVIMTSFVKLLETIWDHDKEEEMMNRISSAKLVIFDDLGSERNTGYALEKVYNFIDARYRSNMPMIITTNISFKEMTEEEDIGYRRIYDRIFECCHPMHWTGISWRKIQARDRFEEMRKFLEE